jgi:hypothetical protein
MTVEDEPWTLLESISLLIPPSPLALSDETRYPLARSLATALPYAMQVTGGCILMHVNPLTVRINSTHHALLILQPERKTIVTADVRVL